MQLQKTKSRDKTREIQIRPKIQNYGGVWTKYAQVVFCARASLCKYNWDKTMFGRSNWCRVLALDSFCWRANEKVDFTARHAELCVCSVSTSKRKVTALFASDNVREHAAARVGSGRLRENTVPRHRQATRLFVEKRAFAKRAQKPVSFSAVFFRVLAHISTWPRKDAHYAPYVYRVRFICFTNINTSRASRSSLLWNTFEICHALLLVMLVQTHDAREETPTLYNYTFCLSNSFPFASTFHLKNRSLLQTI